jgi:ubiquinone/menaquinone biosynthesis C-methylase UbiE
LLHFLQLRQRAVPAGPAAARLLLTPEQYDAWYRTPRGRWIGETEYRLLRRLLTPAPGTSVIDVGCGTGYFARRFALDGHRVTGIDRDPGMLVVARRARTAEESYVEADALALPFGEGEFDYCVSVAALCFMADEAAALAEMLRVTRRGLALGLLNRRSLLFLQKGRRGGSGAYQGAHWHTAHEVRELFSRLPCEPPRLAFAVFLPSGSRFARFAERALPERLPFGAFLAVAARA